MTGQCVTELLVRAADAGPTYLSWTWLVEPFASNAQRLETVALDGALRELDSALPVSRDGESGDAAMMRVLSRGAFADPDGERALMRLVSDAVLPRELVRQLTERLAVGEVRLRLTPSPRLARVPWEILMLDDGRRLVEVLEIRYDPPSTVHASRSVRPEPWALVRERPALFIIDPLLPPRAGLGQALNGQVDRGPFDEHLEDLREDGAALYEDEEPFAPVNGHITRVSFSKALTSIGRSRLFYFGHVDSEPDQPGSASLLLSDTAASSWGMAEPYSPGAQEQPGDSHPDDLRPLAALDLLLGTTMAGEDSTDPLPSGVPGHELWPMPPRVAIIACEGGADYRAAETFGLVIAALDSGAELVTTTRWVMPTDAAFHAVKAVTGTGDLAPTARPTTELALRVSRAHGEEDPVAELAAWQRLQLQAWRTGAGIAYSPLVWAALTHTYAPAR